MSAFRLEHAFGASSHVLGVRLATCSACGVLRVSDAESGIPIRFIRRVTDERERVRTDSPPCVRPALRRRAW